MPAGGHGGPSAWEAVYALVRKIPSGRVMTYGQIALLTPPLSARAVGWAMNRCPEDVPWHRVVNSRGGCSTERLPGIPGGLQRALLEREGVEFGSGGNLSLAEYRWLPRFDEFQKHGLGPLAEGSESELPE